MASYNRIILVGNLTRDPETSTTDSGTAVCKFGIATNRKWKGKDGKEGEEVCFVDCVVFGPAGEAFARYMGVGRSVLIEGRLTFSQWEGKDGSRRSKHGIMVENFTFLGGGKGKDDASEPASPTGDEIPF